METEVATLDQLRAAICIVCMLAGITRVISCSKQSATTHACMADNPTKPSIFNNNNHSCDHLCMLVSAHVSSANAGEKGVHGQGALLLSSACGCCSSMMAVHSCIAVCRHA